MTKILIVLLLVTVFYSSSNAISDDLGGSWTASTSYVGQDWFDIASSSNGQNLIAIGTNQLLQSTNYGVTWMPTSAPTPPKYSSYWGVASSSTGQHLYAVMSPGPVFQSHDFGVTWVNTSTLAHKLPANAEWYDIATSGNGQYVTAVISGGNTWQSVNNGTTWKQCFFSTNGPSDIGTSTIDAGFFSVSMSSSGQYQIVTSGASGSGNNLVYGQVYYSSNYGARFDPSTVSGVNIYSVGTQWIASAMNGNGKMCLVSNVKVGGGLFMSYDYGATFGIMVTVPNVTGIDNIAMSGSGEVQAFSAYTNKSITKGHIYLASEYGTEWNVTDAPVRGWEGIAMNSAGDFLAAAAYGDAIYTYEANCPLGTVHTGFNASGYNNCEACPAGSYTEAFLATTCTECEMGTYSTSSGNNGESSCLDCVWPTTTRSTGDTECAAVYLNTNIAVILVVMGLLGTILATIFVLGNDKQLVVLVIMFFPALDVLTDLSYIIISRFYNPAIFAFCIIFFVHPSVMFFYKLYKYQAWPYSLRFIWWLGSSTTFRLNATTSGRESIHGDHVPFATVFGRRFQFLMSFDNHDGVVVLAWELLNWAVAIFLQAATLVFLPFLVVIWLMLGIFLQMTKTIAMGTVWNAWFYVWTGYGGGLWCDTEGSVDTEDLNYGLLSQFCLETIPHIILQSINNTLLDTWTSDPIAIFSLIMSVFMAVSTIYKYFYHASIRADPQNMKDIPIDRSVSVKILFTQTEWLLLDAKLEPHAREIAIPTVEQRAEQDRWMYGENSDELTAHLVDPVGNSDHTEGDDDEEQIREATVYAPPQLAKNNTAISKNPSAPPAPQAGSSKKKTPLVTATAVSSTPSAPPVASAEPPAELLCPLSGKVMSDPVICSDGHTYERAAIEQHFQSQIDLQHQLSGD
eukprot:gene27693-34455_t